jgi:hypothetical protein
MFFVFPFSFANLCVPLRSLRWARYTPAIGRLFFFAAHSAELGLLPSSVFSMAQGQDFVVQDSSGGITAWEDVKKCKSL